MVKFVSTSNEKRIVSFYRLQTGKIPILETNYTSFASFYPLSDKKKKNSPVETNRHFNVLIRGTKEHEIKYAEGEKNL